MNVLNNIQNRLRTARLETAPPDLRSYVRTYHNKYDVLRNIKLSILVPTVPSRIDLFYPRLIKHLLKQTESYNDIEVLSIFDNKKRTIGEKRNNLMDMANGEYLVFIDDDDRITDDYIYEIMTALYKNPHTDCVVFDSMTFFPDRDCYKASFGIEFEDGIFDINNKKLRTAKPPHVMVYKSSIAKSHRFPHIQSGEDSDWVNRASKDIVKQTRIDKLLYYYDSNYIETSESGSLTDDTIKNNIETKIRVKHVDSMKLKINIDSISFKNINLYPYFYTDKFLDTSLALQIQNEILELSPDMFDRYSNPFEQKNTLRDKFNLPDNLKLLFSYWESPDFVGHLSSIVGHKLIVDETRNFYGVHTYNKQDKLDIHVDAGLHPTSKLKKQLTIGLYLSLNYNEANGCHLEIWKGSNAGEQNPVLYEKVDAIAPIFNRFVMFSCNDYSWHGNPEPLNCNVTCKRIFVTMSYLSENYEDKNKRVKAYFIKRPDDPEDPEKDKLRILRSDETKYKEVYRT